MRQIIHIVVFFLIYFNYLWAGTFNPDAGKTELNINPKDVIIWQGTQADVYPNGKIEVLLRLTTKQDFTLYEEKVSFKSLPGYTIGSISVPATTIILDPISRSNKAVYTGGEFLLTFLGPSNYSEAQFPVSITYIGCTNKICLFPFTETLHLPVVIRNKQDSLGQNGSPLSSGVNAPNENQDSRLLPGEASNSKPALQNVPQDAQDFESKWVNKIKAGHLGLGWLLLICFVAGLGTNLTPCVYPMIPITIRLLGKGGHKPIVNASVYSLGIMISYTGIGLIAGFSGQLFGSLMANPLVNFALALLMFVMAATMLGYVDFSRLQQWGNQLGHGRNSFRNTFLMGCGAGLVASPCTGPILATLLLNAFSLGKVGESTLLIFVYSLGFSLPYIALGGASAHLSRVKLGNKLQIVVEIVFTSVMCGLGFYYLRIPLYGILHSLVLPWFQIGILLLLLAVVGFALVLAKKNSPNAQKKLLYPALILGLSFFSFYQGKSNSSDNKDSLQTSTYFFNRELDGLAAAKSFRRPILIDTWAEWCEACKKMDATTFVDPRVKETLKDQWIFIKMDLTESNDKNDEFIARYGIQGLPTLVFLDPNAPTQKKKLLGGYVNAATLLNEMALFREE